MKEPRELLSASFYAGRSKNRWPVMRENLVGEEQATADMVDKQCQIGSHFSFPMVDSAFDQHWLSTRAWMQKVVDREEC